MSLEPVSLSGKSLNSLSQPNTMNQDQAQVEEKSKYGEEKKSAKKVNTEEIFTDLQNKMKILHNIDLSFSVHESSGKILITVVDEDTGKVIREIPSSEMLDLAAKLEETLGLILDKKV